MKSKSREMALEMSVRKPCHWLAEVIVSMVRRKSLRTRLYALKTLRQLGVSQGRQFYCPRPNAQAGVTSHSGRDSGTG